jgi:allantoinase
MGAFDVLVRGGRVVRPAGVERADIGILDGLIAEIGPDLQGGAEMEIDATGLHVFPGVVDPHVHLNDPGRADWEGFPSGTAAFAAGGGTCLFDMPLNASPPTVDGASFDLKLEAARGRAVVDFCLWGGLVPGNLDRLDELAERGVVGFKAFMCASGIDDFEAADEHTLLEGMRRAARLGLPVAVHAESDALTRRLAERAIAAGRVSVRDYLASRPPVAERDAVTLAIALAEETGCSLHVVHVSTAGAVALVAEARLRGVDVTCETCPHYLVLTDADAERIGALAKCSPPLRPQAEVEALWVELLAGNVPIVASDHSPAPLALKQGDDAFAVWGGISGCQTMRATVLAESTRRDLTLPTVASLTATAAAERFSLPSKGRLEPGRDADLALTDLGVEWELDVGELHYRHPHTPFVGRPLRGRMMRTLACGRTVFDDGRITLEAPHGRLVRPG